MTQKLTQQQKDFMLKRADEGKPITGLFTISLGVEMEVALRILFEENGARYDNNFSLLMREAGRCLLENGVEWRVEKSNNRQLEELKELIQNLRPAVESGDVLLAADAANKLINDTEGFFIE